MNWLETSKTPLESNIKLLMCLLDGYTFEDFVKYGEMFISLKEKK